MSEPTSNLPPFTGLDEFEQFLRGVSEPAAKAEAAANSRPRRPITASRVPLIAAVRAEAKKAAAPVEKRPPPVQILFDAPPPAPVKPPLNDNKLVPRPFTGLPSMTSLDPMSQAPDFGYLPLEPEIVAPSPVTAKSITLPEVAVPEPAVVAELFDPPPPEFGEIAGVGLGDPLQFGKAALELEELRAEPVPPAKAEAEPEMALVEVEARPSEPEQADVAPVVVFSDSQPEDEAADVVAIPADVPAAILLPAPADTLPAIVPAADETLEEPLAEIIVPTPDAELLPDLSAVADALDLNAIVAMSIATAVRGAEIRPNQRPVLPPMPRPVAAPVSRLPMPPADVRPGRAASAKASRSQADGRGRAQLAAVAILSVGVVSATAIFYESGITSSLRNPFAPSAEVANAHHAAGGAAPAAVKAAPLPVASAAVGAVPQASPVAAAAPAAGPKVAATLAAANVPPPSSAATRIAFDAARFSSGSGIDAIAAQLPGMDPGDGAVGDLFDDGGTAAPRSFPESPAAVAQQKAQAAKYGLGGPAAVAPVASAQPTAVVPASLPAANVQAAQPATAIQVAQPIPAVQVAQPIPSVQVAQPVPNVRSAQALPAQAATAAAAPLAKAPAARKAVVLDASEGTSIDPLLNKTWDLNYPKTVPNMK